MGMGGTNGKWCQAQISVMPLFTPTSPLLCTTQALKIFYPEMFWGLGKQHAAVPTFRRPPKAFRGPKTSLSVSWRKPEVMLSLINMEELFKGTKISFIVSCMKLEVILFLALQGHYKAFGESWRMCVVSLGLQKGGRIWQHGQWWRVAACIYDPRWHGC